MAIFGAVFREEVVAGRIAELMTEFIGVPDRIGRDVGLHVGIVQAGVVADHRNAGIMRTANGAVGTIGRYRRDDDRLYSGGDQGVDERRFLADVALGVGFDQIQLVARIFRAGFDAFADTRVETLGIHIDRPDL